MASTTTMSRSRRKTPITGVSTARSEAQDKALWHRAMRRVEKSRLAHQPDCLPRSEHQFRDPWSMAKDGKTYWAKPAEFVGRLMRK